MGEHLATYEDEQEQLRREYEGTPDIKITAPREPEVNPEVWKDVEPILYRGFLTIQAEINGVPFVFKSLNHHEFELLKFSGSFESPNFWSTFLAYGVFMVDGVNILPARDKELPAIAKLFRDLPMEARSKIIRYLSEANRRAAAAVPMTEAYAMELSSRYRWLQLRGLDLTSCAVTGIEGTQRLGLNWSQQLWRALNHVEDRNEEHEREWENAKFIGSCFAGKGISKVYNQDQERRRKEREERISRKDKILREILLGEKQEANTLKIPGAIVIAPRTVEELADQLEKDLKGEKDWHDMVIEQHEALIRSRYSERKAEVEAMARENAAQFGDQRVVGSPSIEGLSHAEAEQWISRRKQLQAQAVARMQVPVADIPDQKTDEFLHKWNMIEDGVAKTDRDPSDAIPVMPNRPKTPPFKR